MSFVQSEFLRAVDESSLSFFTGVPCSYLANLFGYFEEEKKCFFPASREDSACAAAAGAYLGGHLPLVAMQNSGFGNAVNVIHSLLKTYRVPVVFLISHRGGVSPDSPEHTEMGRNMFSLLEACKIPSVNLSSYGAAEAVEIAVAEAQALKHPFAIISNKGDF